MFDPLSDSRLSCTSSEELSSRESDFDYDLSDPEAGQVSDAMPEDPEAGRVRFNA